MITYFIIKSKVEIYILIERC